MQYHKLLYKWVQYFHELHVKVSENAARECNDGDMLSNECNKVFYYLFT